MTTINLKEMAFYAYGDNELRLVLYHPDMKFETSLFKLSDGRVFDFPRLREEYSGLNKKYGNIYAFADFQNYYHEFVKDSKNWLHFMYNNSCLKSKVTEEIWRDLNPRVKKK